jgi:aminomethyltransferase
VESTALSRRTPLYEAHLAAGARMVPFAGWQMPVSYEGVRPEHLAVRSACGVFDVSHMGQIATRGPGALDLLQRLLSNDVASIDVGGAQYAVLCREDGGVLDDLFTYRLGDDRYLTVTNAANHDRDLAWFREHAPPFDAEVRDRLDDYAMLAVQGPTARGIVSGVLEGELPRRMRTATLTVQEAIGGGEALVCGTGYTGEDGVEVLIDPAGAEALWSALLEAGATPAGLGARDTLRLEACFHLYGNDLSVERNPIEAGLGWCCVEETGFIGSDAVARARADGTPERLAPFVLTERGVPRQGNPVLADGEPAGLVTSGTFSPSLEQGVGMAYVRRDLAEPGTELEIDVRGRHRAARVEKRPLLALAGGGA